MPAEYEALETALKEIGIPCAENEWTTRPTGCYITYALEFEADADYGDNQKAARAWEGSVDLWATEKRGNGYVQDIEEALTDCFEGCWMCETKGRYDRESGLFHFEWSFQVEG